MADTDSLIVGFQTQLSDVMETVVKSAMYEVTRLVEDSLLPELKARGQEVIRLRLRLQTTEDQLREAQRTEARAEVTQEQEDNIQIHTDFIGGGHKMEDITSVDNSRCVSRSGPTQELDNTVASLHAVWIPQAILEDCGKLIDNIKKEPVEPTHCSSLNLDTWRVPPDEAPSKCQNASSRTEEPDNHNELLRNIVPQNMDPRISASYGPPSLSLSAQRAHVGNKHALNHSGSPWSKQTSNSLHTNASLNFNSNLDPKPIFRCGQCGKCFPHPSNLKSHLLTHTGERPFCCSLCGRTFTKLSNLKAHRRVHTGERPYSCVSCGKRFTQNCNLKRHQRIHLDV
uniref:C2H2-type domain-containing protein n=1 Tax=Knipowitschia caucasica TaxID=637954 RepID=A0AAV2LIF3_KNICA